MDKVLLRRAAVQSVALLLAVITLSFALRQYHVIMISASNLDNSAAASSIEEEEAAEDPPVASDDIPEEDDPEDQEDPVEVTESTGYPGLFSEADSRMIDQLGESFLIIRKPLGNTITMELEDLYITKSIRITLRGHDGTAMDSFYIGRVRNDVIFVGDPKFIETENTQVTSEGETETVITRDYGVDPFHNVAITSQPIEAGKQDTEIILELDDVYAHIIQEDKNYYYISLKDPREVYEKILVIDAGHGGKDAGAISKDDLNYEKNINLAILLSLKEFLDKEDIKVYYTRTKDDKIFLRPRVELANATGCDMFISIHCNSNEVTEPQGTEILYYDMESNNIKNKELASIFRDEMADATPLEERGLVLRQNDEIFILENASVPAMIIETAYISNSSDLEYLLGQENREEIAHGIFNGIMRAYDEYGSIFRANGE